MRLNEKGNLIKEGKKASTMTKKVRRVITEVEVAEFTRYRHEKH